MKRQKPEPHSKSDRLAAILIGLLFAVCGGAVMYLVPRDSTAGLACGAALLVLGLEALIAAARRRPPLLSKIGPLP